MNTRTRIAVLGLFNSGSTALAGVLHRLGVDMGAPFWKRSEDNAPDNFYEPDDLSRQLRLWWNQPQLREASDRQDRLAYLKDWIEARERTHPGPVGAKHPLLALCGDEILEGWGSSVLILRVCRPYDESLKRLQARCWFPGHEEHLQRTVWDATEAFCARHPHLPVSYQRLRTEQAAVIEEIVDYVKLNPTPAQREAAMAFVHRGSEGGRSAKSASLRQAFASNVRKVSRRLVGALRGSKQS